VHYRPVIDQFPITPILDPAALVLFTAAFVFAALLTMRRAAYGVALLVFVTPFTFYHDLIYTTVTFPKVTLLGVITGLCAHRGAWKLESRGRTAVLAFLAILIAIALSGIRAEHPWATVREFLKWLEYALFLTAVYCGYRIDPDARLVRIAFFSSAAIVFVSALAQEFIGAPNGIWLGDKPAPRISGFLEGPNQLAAYLEVAIAALAAWQIRRPALFQQILLPVAAVTFCLTFSRGAAIGIVSIALAFWLVDREASRKALIQLGYGMLAGFLAIVGWVVGLHSPLAAAIVRPGDIGTGEIGGLGTRTELWRAALFFFRRHPLFGIGADNYEWELAQAGLYGIQTQTNNWYLQQLAEGGIVLFAATITWLVAVLANLRRHLENPWTLAAFGATIALIAHQLVDTLVFYPKIAEPWMVLIGLGMAAPTLQPGAESASESGRESVSPAVAGGNVPAF
jgi:O-antigen ligase